MLPLRVYPINFKKEERSRGSTVLNPACVAAHQVWNCQRWKFAKEICKYWKPCFLLCIIFPKRVNKGWYYLTTYVQFWTLDHCQPVAECAWKIFVWIAAVLPDLTPTLRFDTSCCSQLFCVCATEVCFYFISFRCVSPTKVPVLHCKHFWKYFVPTVYPHVKRFLASGCGMELWVHGFMWL